MTTKHLVNPVTLTIELDDLDAAIGAADMREAVARKIAATLPEQPLVA